MKFWKLCVFWKIYHGIRIFNFHVLKIFMESMEERSVGYKLQKSLIYTKTFSKPASGVDLESTRLSNRNHEKFIHWSQFSGSGP